MRFVRTAENLFGLPAGFQRVEFLQSSGGAYIDTGYVFQSLNHSTTITFKGLAAGSGGQPYHIFGSNTIDTRSGVLSGLTGNNNYIGIGIGGHRSGSSTERVATPTTPKTMTVVSKSTNKFDWIVDGTKVYSDVSFTGSSLSGISEYIFGLNYTSNLTASTTVYHYQAEDNGVVVRDMIPCIDPLGVPCMYDLVGKKPYYNQGTGTFAVGRQVIPVEYLESTGTQYIDTGYIPSNTTGQYAKMKYTTVDSGVTFGGMISGNGVVGPYYATTSGGYWWTRWGTNESKIEASSPTTTDTYEMYLNFNNDRVAKVNNIVISGSLGNISGNYPSLTLFRRNFSASYAYLSGKIYKYQITEGTSLVRDFIPCKDENNVGFMFDKVSGTCYLNAGTGSFSVGENKYTSKLRLIRDAIRIPAGYTRVEYLESSGTQYIDTGVTPTNTHGISINFSFSSNESFDGSWCPIGARTGDIRFWINKSVEASGLTFGFGDYTPSRQTQPKNTLLKASLNLYNNRKMIYVNGNYQENITSSISNFSNTLYLFGANVNGSISFIPPDCRIYKAQISEGSVLVRDFIPCLDASNVPCMYDLVEGKAYYNAGTGSFVVGNDLPTAKVRFIQDVIPSDYIPLKYLESTGTQYIDTGVKQDKLNIQTKFKILNSDASTYGFVLGARYSYNNSVFLVLGRNSSDSHLFEYGDNTNCIIENPYEKDIILSNEGNIVNVNGTTKTLRTKSFSSAYNVFLFACNENNSAILRTQHKTKMYYCKMVYNGVLVRDFYPALRKSDNKPGMYDRITKQFFTNAAESGNDFNYE